VSVAVPTGLLTLVSVLLKNPDILQNYVWIIPLLVAVDKYLKDRRNMRERQKFNRATLETGSRGWGEG